MNRLKTITRPAERVQSNGASVAPIKVSAFASVFICVSVSCRALHDLAFTCRLYRRRPDPHSVERTPDEEHRHEEEYQSENLRQRRIAIVARRQTHRELD